MPAIQIPDDTYQKLARRAEALGTTVEALVAPALEREAAVPPANPAALSYEEWKKGFDELTAFIRSQAHHFPPGFRADDSRESIYEGCGE